MLDSILLQIAKSTILSHFDNSFEIDRESLYKNYPYLQSKGASFVTLHFKNNLRGCIGSIIAHTNLLDDVIHNAQSAAFRDSRFNALNKEEFSHLTLEVSLLTQPKKLQYKDFNDLRDKIKPKIDGIILELGSHRGTFLPQVWEQLQTPELFLEHLSYKAGSNMDIYKFHPDIYIYQVEAIESRFDAILPL